MTHTNATLASFKSNIAAQLGKDKANMFLKYGEKNDVRGDKGSVNLKGATLLQAGLNASTEHKVYATVLPQKLIQQQTAQPIADAVMGVASYYETLFELCAAAVASGDSTLATRVWTLIQTLPSSTTELQALEVPGDANWEGLLGKTHLWCRLR